MRVSLSRRLRVTATLASVFAMALGGAAQGAAPSGPTAPTRAAAPPIEGKQLVFAEEFDAPIVWGERWNGTGTAAYKYWDHNDWYMVDWITRDAISVHDGIVTFTATPSEKYLEDGTQAWDTGLLSTEHTRENFLVRTGDYMETRVQLPTQMGAWPALWTWTVGRQDFRGNSEVDTFEYHPNGVDDLEFTNHVRYSNYIYSNYNDIGPGRWITVGSHYRTQSIDWYVNGKKVYGDGKGVPGAWRGNPILNLSIVDGTYHPVPTDPSITFNADYVRVFRPVK
ncbi:beta-glucanase [Streptomyces polyrhachis]|uniref:Beta-glucanase n=1 Tax=Streptomyces polyrhachis TaxID=1282885 RepID=A0ABW2GC45_9ACTN